ncbi:long-chain acyl-CoA synthetase [Devosia enhydra]|uniref:Long-chain acyl-CoA synthetase n=1 Tax=Devosia enhydra TaxID=665118 RepID=A0A1K2HWZ6_9HYPH|nr:long-chain fatty acid--CoA ligase [Devosia enhydra]SFZ83701.1 long-chain acyl-CoA synthetase [Devosia enhydra]
MTDVSETGHARPWVDNYPPGIRWDTPIETTPIHEQVLAVCRRTPQAPALDFLGAVTTYAELGDAIEAFAGALQQRFGIGKGSRVALLLPNTPFFVIAYYGILRAGGTVVNCNPLYTVSELSHIVAHSRADLMITLDLTQLFEKAQALVEAGHARKLIVCHFPEALSFVKKWLFRIVKGKELTKVGASPIADRCTDFGSLVRLGLKPAAVTIDATRDVAVQQYTGGTTGLPKGALLSHANVAANVSQINAWGEQLFFPPSKVVAVLPFFHIFAMTTCMNLPLRNGAQVVMLPRFELKALVDLIARTEANVLMAVPTLLAALAKGVKEPAKLASIKVAVSGGAPLSEETRTRFAKISAALLAEGYGLTEASPVVCCAALRVPSKPMSIGQPLPGTDLRFVGVDSGEVQAPGGRGEIQVKGKQVMLGYFEDEEASRSAFADGWLRTGDVGYVDEDGYVFIVDRIKDLIIVSGFNVYPRVIEEALVRHEAVDECTVIGAPDPYRGEVPVAFVKLKDGKSATEEEIKRFLSETLNKLEMPREIIFRDALPKTLIGKLSKKELREEYRQKKAGPGA